MTPSFVVVIVVVLVREKGRQSTHESRDLRKIFQQSPRRSRMVANDIAVVFPVNRGRRRAVPEIERSARGQMLRHNAHRSSFSYGYRLPKRRAETSGALACRR